MTEVTPNLPHLGNFCKYCFMGTLLVDAPCFLSSIFYSMTPSHIPQIFLRIAIQNQIGIA